MGGAGPQSLQDGGLAMMNDMDRFEADIEANLNIVSSLGVRNGTADIAPSIVPDNTSIRFRLVPLHELKRPITRNYLIKGLFPRQGLVIVWGPPKCGKSFWVFDAVAHIAMNAPDYRGHRLQGAEIVYLALEGQAGFPSRKDAFYIEQQLPPDREIPLYVCGATLDLIKDHKKLITDIKTQSRKPGCVVIDTMNRSLVGSESKDEDMAAYIRAADAIQKAFGCLVIIIHHCGHDQNRPRGHSSLIGAEDVEISVKKNAANEIVSTVERAKDMQEGAVFVSRLKVIDLGLDPDGDMETSCSVLPVDNPIIMPKEEKRPESRDARTFRDAFVEALDKHGQTIRVRDDEPASPQVKAVEVEKVRLEFYRRHATGETDPKKRAAAQRQAFNRQRKADGYGCAIMNDVEWMWRTQP